MKTTPMTPRLYDYVIKHCDMPRDILVKIDEETQKQAYAVQQSPPDQAAFMHMAARLMNAKYVLEIGCLTGYSTIAMASALAENGKVITLELNAERAEMATNYFRTAGLQNRIELRLGRALDSLKKLEQEVGQNYFDLCFIDADKEPLWQYYEHALNLLRKGGLIIVDNVIWSGAVIDETDGSPETVAIKEFNDRVFKDQRVEHVMLHISDGIYLLRKK